jgi:hypothetical protein
MLGVDSWCLSSPGSGQYNGRRIVSCRPGQANLDPALAATCGFRPAIWRLGYRSRVPKATETETAEVLQVP